MLLIALQIALLFLTSAGWGHLLKHLLARNRPDTLARSVLYLAAGFCLQIVVLQNLVYCRVPVRFSFVLPLLAGAFGCWRYLKARPLAGMRRSVLRDHKCLVTILIPVLLIQGIGVASQGVGNYYGKAHDDQVGYTLLSEFLLTRSYGLRLEQIGLEPWLLRAWYQQNQRMGQSVAQAYGAALTLVDAKTSYAATTLFFVLLLTAVAFGLSRSFALRPTLAISAALLTGISPAVTRIHLDGFLSQTSTLFVFPALILLSCRDDLRDRERVALSSSLLCFQLLSYPELYVVAVFVWLCASMIRGARRPLPELRTLMFSVALSLALVPGYFTDALALTRQQYLTASMRPQMLEDLVPSSGTLVGWVRLFLDVPFGPRSERYRVLVIAGISLTILCIGGTYSCSIRRRLQLLLAALGPWMFLAILLAAVDFAKYPFSKILEQFISLWILLIMLGFARTVHLIQRSDWAWTGKFLWLVPMLLLAGATLGTIPEQLSVARGQAGRLPLLNKASFLDALDYVKRHPKDIYIIHGSDSSMIAWLAYAARGGVAYVESYSIANAPINPATMAFARLPEDVCNATYVGDGGVRETDGADGAMPEVEVKNPQGTDGSGDSVWYWLGDALTLGVRRCGDESRLDEYELSFHAEAGPADPSMRRIISIMGTNMKEPRLISFENEKTVRVPILLARGLNDYLFEVVEPRAHIVRFPNDERKHMIRISAVQLSKKRSMTGQEAQMAGWMLPSALLAEPEVVVRNPQGEEGRGPGRWYWLGDSLEIDVARKDAQAGDVFGELRVRAEPGPAYPTSLRVMALINRGNGERKILSLRRGGFVSAGVRLAPGLTTFVLEVMEPKEPVNGLPSGRRREVVALSGFQVHLWALRR